MDRFRPPEDRGTIARVPWGSRGDWIASLAPAWRFLRRLRDNGIPEWDLTIFRKRPRRNCLTYFTQPPCSFTPGPQGQGGRAGSLTALRRKDCRAAQQGRPALR